MSTLSAFKQAYLDKERKSFEKIYVLVDLHGTVIKPNYTFGKVPTDFYTYAIEAMQIMSKQKDICLIMYTCSHPEEIKQYVALFEANKVHFDFINENPEVVSEPNGYGCYDKKLYMNLILDDKAGFEAEKEWFDILCLLEQRYPS